MDLNFAYLSEGRLYLQEGNAPARLIESPFAQGLIDRDARDQQRHGWKSKNAGGPLPSGMLWSFRGGLPGAGTRRVQINGVTRGREQAELIYVLDTDRTSGLFLYNTSNGEERRLVHRKDFRAQNLTRHPTGGWLACSVSAPDGSAHIAIMEPDGSRLRDVTEGDAFDENPAWIAGDRQRLVFQSAGIARDHAGFAPARGPAALMELDLDRGNLASLHEDPQTDFLLPRSGSDGSLYFIRRPYRNAHAFSARQYILDVVCFPYRLLRAILGFLNVFSLMFSGKPLTTAGGPKVDTPDQRFLMLYGSYIDAQKAARAAGPGGDKSLVPASWELVRQPRGGSPEVLANRVVAYDLCADGGLVYTDGFKIYHRDAQGAVRNIGAGKVVERVLVVG